MRITGLRTLLVCSILTTLSLTVQAQMLDDLGGDPMPLTSKGTQIAGKASIHTLESGPLNRPYTGIAVEAVIADTGVSAEVRFQSNGAWESWQSMRIVRSAVGEGLVAGFRGQRREPASRFEVRFQVESGTGVQVLGSSVFDNTQDEDAAAPPVGFAPLAGATDGHIIPPALITRDEWGARPFIRGTPVSLASPSHDFMTFHHAAGFSGFTREEGVAQLRAIQDLHQDVRGWSDIGYHFVIDRGGRLYQGRPFLNGATSLNDLPVFARGAHVGGANTGNIGICLLGCYHPPEGGHCTQEITDEALETYTTLFAFLSERYGVPASQIRGHRDFSSTACPGDNNYTRLPEIRTAVSNLLITGNAPLAEATMTATADETGVVTVSWTFQAQFDVVGYRLERWIGDNVTILQEGAGAAPDTFTDGAVVTTEPVSYRLYVQGSDGREQRVALAEVVIGRPTGHLLAEAFPNPASGRVSIRYYLPSQGRVRLEVFDLTGRTVSTLVETVQDGESWYAAPLDASSLPGGVYFYRVQVEGFSGVVFDETHPLVINP